jgi:Uma2 family endonuclease
MIFPLVHKLKTEAEYLTLERAAIERHEYLDGYIYAMAGESLAHSDICTNVTGLLFNQLKGRNCRALSKDTKVRSGPCPFAARNIKGFIHIPTFWRPAAGRKSWTNTKMSLPIRAS